ncbi:hypothetical protein EVAR_20905_1 [Eumeta japonica]|uniref:Uncharacterized protein n=1 Tax=Eumeta variegata TaxID=151549 RepID=A0A4C1UWT7_EUMVA|nr:hypothetical protein EVAR_20905_1 [Eumeta japonica]
MRNVSSGRNLSLSRGAATRHPMSSPTLVSPAIRLLDTIRVSHVDNRGGRRHANATAGATSLFQQRGTERVTCCQDHFRACEREDGESPAGHGQRRETLNIAPAATAESPRGRRPALCFCAAALRRMLCKCKVKPVLIISSDGGPDKNPRYRKVIAHAIEHFKKYDLDAIFIETNAPSRSAFNRIERRMASLSRELTGKRCCNTRRIYFASKIKVAEHRRAAHHLQAVQTRKLRPSRIVTRRADELLCASNDGLEWLNRSEAAVHADASLTQVGERQMSNAAERGGRLCLFVARSALSLALQALNGTPQSEERPRSGSRVPLMSDTRDPPRHREGVRAFFHVSKICFGHDVRARLFHLSKIYVGHDVHARTAISGYKLERASYFYSPFAAIK